MKILLALLTLGTGTAALAQTQTGAPVISAMPGIETWPSETNFVLARVPDARRAFDGLLDAGILVKNLDGWHPLLARCLRITVGTPAENDALLRALAKLT